MCHKEESMCVWTAVRTVRSWLQSRDWNINIKFLRFRSSSSPSYSTPHIDSIHSIQSHAARCCLVAYTVLLFYLDCLRNRSNQLINGTERRPKPSKTRWLSDQRSQSAVQLQVLELFHRLGFQGLVFWHVITWELPNVSWNMATLTLSHWRRILRVTRGHDWLGSVEELSWRLPLQQVWILK